jgi:hypothetical protein
LENIGRKLLGLIFGVVLIVAACGSSSAETAVSIGNVNGYKIGPAAILTCAILTGATMPDGTIHK